jgi:hypothetical protein
MTLLGRDRVSAVEGRLGSGSRVQRLSPTFRFHSRRPFLRMATVHITTAILQYSYLVCAGTPLALVVALACAAVHPGGGTHIVTRTFTHVLPLPHDPFPK